MASKSDPVTNSRYDFETAEFGIDQIEFHLLRNGYNYKSYLLSDIKSVEIKKGPEIANWFIVLILGLGLLGFAFYTIFGLWRFFNSSATRISIQQIILPLFPLLIGIYCTITALKRTRIIVFHFASAKKSFPLTKLIKSKKDKEFIDFVRTNTGKLKILD